MQLTIKTTDGQSLDLAPDTTLSFDLKNTAFDSEVLLGSYSLPINLPPTPNNRLLFGFPENPASKNAVYQLEVIVSYGAFNMIGTLKLKKVSSKQYTTVIMVGISNASDTLKNTMLNDIDFKEALPPLFGDARPNYSYELSHYFVFAPDEHGAWSIPRNIPNGTIIGFSIYRYDPNSYQTFRTFYQVPFRDSIYQFTIDVVDTINRHNPIPNYSATAVYEQFNLVYDNDGNVWEASQHSQGKPLVPGMYSAIQTYQAGDYVRDADEYVYRCLVNGTTGQAPPNTAYWIEEDYPFWLMVATAANVEYSLFINQASPHIYKYDWPTKDYTITAELVSLISFRLLDNTNATPYPIDTYLSMFFNPSLGLNNQGNTTIDVSLPANGSCFTGQYFDNNTIADPLPYNVSNYLDRKLKAFFPETSHIFYPIYNPTGTDRESYEGYVNDFAMVGFYLKEDYYASPQLFLFHIFERIAKHIGYSLDYSAFEATEYQDFLQTTVYNNNSFDTLINAIFAQDKHNVPVTEIDLSRHVPAVTLGQFLNAIRTALGIHIDFLFYKKTIVLQPLQALAKNSSLEEEDWTNIVEPLPEIEENDTQGFTLSYEDDPYDKFWGDMVQSLDSLLIGEPVQTLAELSPVPLNADEVRFVIEKRAYYKPVPLPDDEVTIDHTHNWEFYSFPFDKMVVGDGQENFTSNATPLTMNYLDNTVTGAIGDVSTLQWTVPQISQPLSLIGLNTGQKPFNIRLAIYRGLQKNSLNMLYPLATNDVYDYHNNIIGRNSLYWTGAYGLYEKMYKEWLGFRATTKPVTFQARIEPYHLASLQFGKAIRIKGVRYLIGQVRITLPIKKTAELKLYKL